MQKMCFNAKSSISAWWILIVIALFLWYRNSRYDRVLSVFILLLAVIQLIEYGIHNGADPISSGRALFLTLWLQCLVLVLAVFVYLQNCPDDKAQLYWLRHAATILLVAFTLIFILALIYSFSPDVNFFGAPGTSGHIEWYLNGGFILGPWGWLYLIGIFIPLLLLWAHTSFTDITLPILILYGILSALFVATHYPAPAFSSMWCYLAVGFAFLAWFLGILQTEGANCA